MGTNLKPVAILTDCYEHQRNQYGAAIIKDEKGKRHRVTFDFNRNDSTSPPWVRFADGRIVVVSDHFVSKMDRLLSYELLEAKEKEEVCKQFPREKKSYKGSHFYIATGLRGGIAHIDNKEKSFVNPMSPNGVFSLAPYFEIGKQSLNRGSDKEYVGGKLRRGAIPPSLDKKFVRVGMDYADSSQTSLRKYVQVGIKTQANFPKGEGPVEFYGGISLFSWFGFGGFAYSLLNSGRGTSPGGIVAAIGVGLVGGYFVDSKFGEIQTNELIAGLVHQPGQGLLATFEMPLFSIGVALFKNLRIELKSLLLALFKQRPYLDQESGELKKGLSVGLEYQFGLGAEWIY